MKVQRPHVVEKKNFSDREEGCAGYKKGKNVQERIKEEDRERERYGEKAP